MNDNILSKMKTTNDNISAILQKLIDAISRTDNHDNQLAEISPKQTMMDHQFDRKCQSNISPSDQIYEKQEEE